MRKAGERQRRDEGAPLDVAAISARLAVKLAGGGQQIGDLDGIVEVGARRLVRLDLASPDPDGVTVDELVLDGALEDLAEPGERFVDRLGAELALAQLVVTVTVDLAHVDLTQRVAREEGQQVVR